MTTTQAHTDNARRELARRVNGDLEVTLYWNQGDNSTSVELHYPGTEETLTFAAAPDRALDAFHHPFAYLAELESATTRAAIGEFISLIGGGA